MDHVPAQSPSSLPANPVKVRSVPLTPPITVRFLGPLRGLLTHWAGKHSVPCEGPEKCPAATHRKGTFFKAYSPVMEWIPHLNRWRPAVLEATANLEEYLRGRKLRGETWMLARDDGSKSTRPVVAAYLETIPEDKLPLAFDIVPVLQRLFNRVDLVLDVPNPTPQHIVLPEIVDAPPTIPADLQPPPPVGEDPEQRKRVLELLEEGRKKLGLHRSTGGSAGHNGQKTSTNGTNGHF